MRRLTSKRLLQLASLLLAALTALFAVLWAVRGARPAVDCGLMAAMARGDWRAAYACLNQAEYDALLAVVALAGSTLAWIASRKASDKPIGEYNPTPAEHARNREYMIERVSRIWIEGHLDQVLYQAVLASLGMTWRAAVPRPGSLSLHRPGEQEQAIPADTPIVQLFDDAQHKLLILGEPGSGKTTIMLDLARSLLKQARSDTTSLIPVILNLSSLTEPEQSLEDWLVSELLRNYVVPTKLARYWLAHEELALLLDGLDEVRADCRAGVVEKLNRYRSEHLAPWLVICCRNNEYAELSAAGSSLEDVDAVVLQPLTRDQTENYLAGLDGPEPQQLWNALKGDTALLEVADTPLMLNVMLLAADQLDWDALPSDRGSEAVRSDIYDAYLRSMLARSRSTGRAYPDDKTLHWLYWLAGEMVAHGQTVFLLERMNRSWFNRPWQRFIWVPIFGLIYGLIFGLIFELISGLIGEPSVGLSVGLLFGLFFGLLGLEDITLIGQVRFRFDRGGWVYGLRGGLIAGLFAGLCWGLVMLSDGLIFGLKFGLVMGLFWGLSTALIVGLLRGLIHYSLTFEENYSTRRPNAAVHQSLRNGLIIGLIGGLIIGLIGGLFGELIIGLIFGLLLGSLFGLIFGLGSVIQHYTLRLVLFFDGSMPLNYVRFLDDCVDRVFLRRVGGGYIFIHRTFMEHVAGLDLSEWQTLPG